MSRRDECYQQFHLTHVMGRQSIENSVEVWKQHGPLLVMTAFLSWTGNVAVNLPPCTMRTKLIEKLLKISLYQASQWAFGSTVDIARKEKTGFLSCKSDVFSQWWRLKVWYELLSAGTQSPSACSLVSCEMKDTQNVWFTNHDLQWEMPPTY